jgi:hypothetical protein
MTTPGTVSAPTAASLFMTHHSPVGAWASLTFGAAGRGICIDHEKLLPEPNADFLVAVHREGTTTALPFVEGVGAFPGWRVLGEGDVARTLSACVDTFVAESAGISLKVFTPHPALPNPKRSGNLQYSTVPGVLLEVSIDNSNSDSPATAFVGVNLRKGMGGLRPLDWSSKTLCGVGSGSNWVLAAAPVKDEVFTVQAANIAEHVAAGTGMVEPGATAGGIAIKVAARSKKTVQLVFAFYHSGTATQGIEGRYLYTVYFPRVEAVANFILANSAKILESCTNFDSRAAAACGDSTKLAVFSQAVRTYEANTQLIDAVAPPSAQGQQGGGNVPYFTVIEGAAGYRNSLSVAVDHLPWELYRNPWVVRNIFDLATTNYAYHDRVRFPSDGESAGELREGGMTFVHDFGYHTTYTPASTSALERANVKGAGGAGAFMSAEELLNGVYLLTSYALLADDTPWAKTRLPFARELMVNLENRDHWDPERRTGILKGESEKTGSGAEATALAFLGEELGGVPGNLYIAVKTFCANMLLTTYYQNNNDLHSADYSYAFAQKTAASLVAAFDATAGILPANLLRVDTSAGAVRLIAALEPLAVPTYLGLTSTLPEYFAELFNVLKTHAMSCLKGGCVDAAAGGLRLASSSSVVSVGKVINVLYVLERLFGIDVATEYPTLWREVGELARLGADAVDVSRRAVVGAVNSPRVIASALFVKPVVAAS